MEDVPLEIMGVAPRGSQDSRQALHYGDPHYLRRDLFWLTVMGRRKRGWTTEAVSQQLTALSPELFEATVPSGYSTNTLARYRAMRLEAAPGGRGISWLLVAGALLLVRRFRNLLTLDPGFRKEGIPLA